MAHVVTRARGAAAPRTGRLRLDRLERRSRRGHRAWSLLGGAYLVATLRRHRIDPVERASSRRRRRRSTRASPSCSGRSPGPCTTCRTTISSARTWSSICCWPSPCRRSSCTARPGGCSRPFLRNPRVRAPRTLPHAAVVGLRRLQSRAGGVAPAARLQPRDEQSPDPHRAAPDDHVRRGAPLVADALARARAAARAVPACSSCISSSSACPMVVVSIFITMADSVLYPYYAAAPRVWQRARPPRRPAPRRADHVDSRRPASSSSPSRSSSSAGRSAGGDDVALPMVEARHHGRLSAAACGQFAAHVDLGGGAWRSSCS